MKNWFLQKNDAEQKIIVGLAVFMVLVLMSAYLYMPLKRSNNQLQGRIDTIENDIVIMRNLEPQLARFANKNVVSVNMDDTQIMELVEQVASQQHISLSNVKTQGKNKISVNLNNVSFNVAMRWLDVLQNQYHVTLSQLSAQAEKKGLTNMTVIIGH